MPADFCFTVDLDRDVNFFVADDPSVARSLDRGEGTEPRFESTKKGLEILVNLLDELGITCTFFCEGHTIETIRDVAGLLDGFEIGVHGYDHEYFPGMIRPDMISAVQHGIDAIKDVTNRAPTCFRAPYMKMPRDIGDFLKGTGIRIDSSSYAKAEVCVPKIMPGYVVELPVAEGTDFRGKKMRGYLWQMHEGSRGPADYSDLGNQIPEDGCYVLADHTWHIVESRERGIFSDLELKDNIERTRLALSGILDSGHRQISVTEASKLAVQ